MPKVQITIYNDDGQSNAANGVVTDPAIVTAAHTVCMAILNAASGQTEQEQEATG